MASIHVTLEESAILPPATLICSKWLPRMFCKPCQHSWLRLCAYDIILHKNPFFIRWWRNTIFLWILDRFQNLLQVRISLLTDRLSQFNRLRLLWLYMWAQDEPICIQIGSCESYDGLTKSHKEMLLIKSPSLTHQLEGPHSFFNLRPSRAWGTYIDQQLRLWTTEAQTSKLRKSIAPSSRHLSSFLNSALPGELQYREAIKLKIPVRKRSEVEEEEHPKSQKLLW